MPRMGRVLAVLLTALASATGAFAFDLQGHRGARALEPENTLPAFARALEIGVTTLEMDAAVTADGVVVVSHDPALNPAFTRGGDGRFLAARGPLIRSLTHAELQAYDVGRLNPDDAYARAFPRQQPRDGTPIPRLADVFALVRARGADAVRFDIETKVFPNRPGDTLAPRPFVEALLAVIREAGMARRTTIQSFDWRTLAIVQALAPEIETVYLTGTNLDGLRDGSWSAGRRLGDFPSVAHMVKAAGGTTWAPNHTTLTADAVREARALGLKVIPWTVNDAEAADRLIGWGVDGLIGDDPLLLREALQRRGLPLPPAVPVR